METKLTQERFNALITLQTFVYDDDTDAVILRGSAGTGKTTLIAQLAQSLIDMHVTFKVLAPTGRAARILSNKLSALLQDDPCSCSTIHGAIYSLKNVLVNEEAESANDPGMRLIFPLRQDEPAVQLLIIDESSMVGDRKQKNDLMRFGSGRLLSDLIQFARTGRKNAEKTQLTKLLFVGDHIQLPPVGEAFSPALSESYLQDNYGLRVRTLELQTVYRQAQDSALLEQASTLRKQVMDGQFNEFKLAVNDQDISRASVSDALDRIVSACRDKTSSVVVVPTNASALAYNRSLRERLWGRADQPVRAGDLLLVNKNAWFHGLANGDLVKVMAVGEQERVMVPIRGGYRQELVFRQVTVAYREWDGSVVYKTPFILENLLDAPDRELSAMEVRALLVHFRMRHPHLSSKSDEFSQALQADSYFNAVQVKYGYAMTCHKAQGGEWDTAIVDFTNSGGKRHAQFFRWAYTAITRARKNLLVVNPPSFTASSHISWADDFSASALGKQSSLDELQADPDWERFSFSPALAPLMRIHQQLRAVWAAQGIEIRQLQHLQYQERYTLAQGDRHAVVQYYYNGKHHISRASTGPGAGLDPELLEAALAVIRSLGTAAGAAQSADAQEPFIADFLQQLDAALAGSNIRRNSCEHLPYRLRIGFADGQRQGRIDFSYNGKSVWTSAQEVGGPGSTQGLYQEVQQLVARPQPKDDA